MSADTAALIERANRRAAHLEEWDAFELGGWPVPEPLSHKDTAAEIRSLASALTSLLSQLDATRAERDGLAEALRPFVDLTVQPSQETVKLINRNFPTADLITVRVTKSQYHAALASLKQKGTEP